MTNAAKFWSAVLKPFGLEPLVQGTAQKLVEELNRVSTEKARLAARAAGLEQGIHAANETARRIAARAKLAAALNGEPCNVVAEIDMHRVGGGEAIRLAIPCMRHGVHDEHRFEDAPDSDNRERSVLVTLRGVYGKE